MMGSLVDKVSDGYGALGLASLAGLIDDDVIEVAGG